MRYRLGLKIGSINTQYTKEIVDYYEKGVFQFIELFTLVESFENTIDYWRQFEIPFGIHAPHSMAGLNLANPKEHNGNKVKIEETIRFAEALNAEYIVFHSGINGNSEEVVHQLFPYADSRFLIENKPVKGFDGNYICVGTDYIELKKIIDSIGKGTGFCLDFGHAICAARTHRRNPLDFIRELKSLNPRVYHLTDGDYSSEIDSHYHYGKGSFPLTELLKFVPDDGMMVNEAKRDNMSSLKEFYLDSIKLNDYSKS